MGQCALNTIRTGKSPFLCRQAATNCCNSFSLPRECTKIILLGCYQYMFVAYGIGRSKKPPVLYIGWSPDKLLIMIVILWCPTVHHICRDAPHKNVGYIKWWNDTLEDSVSHNSHYSVLSWSTGLLKELLGWKQVHVGMKPSNTDQSRWILHQQVYTFCISHGILPTMHTTKRFTSMLVYTHPYE